MHYALLIYVSETVTANFTPQEQGAYFKDYAAFHAEVVQRGIRKGGTPLQPVATATTVRARSGKPLITDGPFAETKEQLAGFYILDCKDLDEAIAIASKIPDVNYGSIEIRPVLEISSS